MMMTTHSMAIRPYRRDVSRAQPGRVGAVSSRTTILAVEDDPAVAEMTAEMLRELGYVACVAHNAPEALAMIEALEHVDLVFSDIVMPGGMDGIELARRIRVKYPDMPVLLATGYTEAAVRSRLEFPMLLKPFQIEDLAARLEFLLGRQGPSGGGFTH